MLLLVVVAVFADLEYRLGTRFFVGLSKVLRESGVACRRVKLSFCNRDACIEFC